MRVEVLDVGAMTAAAGVWRGGEEDRERPVRVPVPAYLIETADERILVDTGLHPDAAADADARYGSGVLAPFELEQERSIAERVDLDTITMLVLTHLHFDHAGGLALVPDSVPVYVQRVEWEASRDPVAIERNFFLPLDYSDPPSEINLLDGDTDLLGDGTVELLSTPGHTPGHQSVRAGDLVLGIDVVHYESSLDDLRFPPFADDHDAQRRSAERLRELRDSGLGFRPGHDPAFSPGPVQ